MKYTCEVSEEVVKLWLVLNKGSLCIE